MSEPILIIDESRLVREAMAKILLSRGLPKTRIACVESIEDAIEFCEFSPISLLICSDSYADTTAIEIHQQLQSLLSVDNLPLLVLSQQSSADKNTIPLSVTNQITIYKPFKQQQVIEALFSLTQLAAFSVAENTQDKSSPTANKMAKPEPAKPSILVVDDESSNIDVAAGNLRQHYRVIAAKSGEHALKIINAGKHTIELILLDIMMPNMDGYQVCASLKKQPLTASIPVIFLSAKSEVADIKYGFDLGAVDYITKPLNGDLLRARVATHIRLQQQKAALAQQVVTLKENAKLREDIEKITHHDLKGPLNNILFETFRLQDKSAAKSINSAVNNVVDMINNSLNLYKIEQGIYQLSPQSVNINQMIKDAVNAVTVLAEEKSLKFKFQGFEQEIQVNGEALLCLSIFNNLIKNAVEASQADQQITLALTHENNFVSFQVVNQGVIPKDIREKLFDKYSSSNHHSGTGLGTYSAKLMTEVQHGEIYFQIIDEQQTRFVVNLPSA